jgi:hypothetical protein
MDESYSQRLYCQELSLDGSGRTVREAEARRLAILSVLLQELGLSYSSPLIHPLSSANPYLSAEQVSVQVGL